MYKYKINNSYTVYVNEGYYWDVKRDCDKRRKTKLSGGARAAQKSCSKGIMAVQFAEKTVHFIYPDVIKKGQLKVVQ